jgi:hypothetical protein
MNRPKIDSVSFCVHAVAKQPIISIDLDTEHGINDRLVPNELDLHPEFVVGSEVTLPLPLFATELNVGNFDDWPFRCLAAALIFLLFSWSLRI